MRVTISPSKAKGIIEAPPSKSMAHRYLIAAALAEGESRIEHLSYSEDILATLDCLEALGVSILRGEDYAVISGGGTLCPHSSLPCRESGSTLRFLLPLCLLAGEPATLLGSARLLERPLGVYESLCAEKGFSFSRSAEGISVCGTLSAGEYVLPGDISSQFITGMIFALLKIKGQSKIHLTGKVESGSYIDLTLAALQDFGFFVERAGEKEILIDGSLCGKGRTIAVEGDYSNAAFFDALCSLGHSVKVKGLRPDSIQGDRIYRQYFELLEKGDHPFSLADCPDLGPILMAVAAAKQGGIFVDTARLKIKESDRGAAMAEELSKFGVSVMLEENRIIVPKGNLCAPKVPLWGHNDHRIVMSLAVLCTLTGGVIEGAQAVAKSMPDFFEKLALLGVEVMLDETE